MIDINNQFPLFIIFLLFKLEFVKLVHFIIIFSKTDVYECCQDYKNVSGTCEGIIFFTHFMDKGNTIYELYNLSKWKNRTRINLNIKLFLKMKVKDQYGIFQF